MEDGAEDPFYLTPCLSLSEFGFGRNCACMQCDEKIRIDNKEYGQETCMMQWHIGMRVIVISALPSAAFESVLLDLSPRLTRHPAAQLHQTSVLLVLGWVRIFNGKNYDA